MLDSRQADQICEDVFWQHHILTLASFMTDCELLHNKFTPKISKTEENQFCDWEMGACIVYLFMFSDFLFMI